MKLLQKITSLVVTATIVMGLGSSIMAAPKSVKVDAAHFPDPGFRAYVSKNYDTDHNGTLSVNEVYGALYMAIDGKDNVESLQGIKYLSFLKEIVISDTVLDDKKLDLFSDFNLIKLYLINVKGIEELTPGIYTTNLEIDFCDNIKKINLEDCDYVSRLWLINDKKLRGNIDTSSSTYLRDLLVMSTGVTSVTVNKNAKLTSCIVDSSVKIVKK
ncbi:MAG: hypothetical protein K6G47_08790 [Clostridia bacterium]|nr:hypothetical protein [Clostridia bacterium]